MPGFFVTWATVLFAPWVFARQAVERISAAHALVFGLVCFAGTFAAMLWGAELNFLATWLTTALIYIPLQTVLLSILDFSGWRQPPRSVRFWFLVSCYASAIMLTEVANGPPLLLLSDLLDMLANRMPSSQIAAMYPWSWDSAIRWAQVSLWVFGLACCYGVRLRSEWLPRRVVLLAAIVAALSVLMLYGGAVEYVGLRVADWFRL